MTRADQILLIKVLLDELPSGFEGMIVTNNDPKPLDFYINKILDDSADETQRLIPRHLLRAATWTVIINSISADGVALIDLPNDYVRVGELKFASWLYPAHSEISIDNPNHHLQHNPFTSGYITKPVLVRTPNMQLEAHRVSQGDTATGYYIPKYARDVNNQIPDGGFVDDLARFVGWYTAAKLAQMFQNDKAAQYCMAQFVQLVKINTL